MDSKADRFRDGNAEAARGREDRDLTPQDPLETVLPRFGARSRSTLVRKASVPTSAFNVFFTLAGRAVHDGDKGFERDQRDFGTAVLRQALAFEENDMVFSKAKFLCDNGQAVHFLHAFDKDLVGGHRTPLLAA